MLHSIRTKHEFQSLPKRPAHVASGRAAADLGQIRRPEAAAGTRGPHAGAAGVQGTFVCVGCVVDGLNHHTHTTLATPTHNNTSDNPPRHKTTTHETKQARGTLHLTNIRLLFLADKPTMGGQGGVALASFDIPLRCVSIWVG